MRVVKDNLEVLVELFEYIRESPQNFDSKSINEAQGFLLALSSFDFNLLLNIYALIFPFTECLFNIFQSKSMDILFCSTSVQNTISELEKIRHNSFEDIWNLIVAKCGIPTCRKARSDLQPHVHYRALFLEILDTILIQMRQRFKSIKDIEFIELLDCQRFELYSSMATFLEKSVQL